MSSKEFKICVEDVISVAHALSGYEGKCSQIHGHNYKLKVCISGKINNDKNDSSYGMVMDYKELKKIVKQSVSDEFDHRLILSENTYPEVLQVLQKYYSNIMILTSEPSCENLILEFVNRIQKALPDSFKLSLVKLSESETTYTEWEV